MFNVILAETRVRNPPSPLILIMNDISILKKEIVRFSNKTNSFFLISKNTAGRGKAFAVIANVNGEAFILKGSLVPSICSDSFLRFGSRTKKLLETNNFLKKNKSLVISKDFFKLKKTIKFRNVFSGEFRNEILTVGEMLMMTSQNMSQAFYAENVGVDKILSLVDNKMPNVLLRIDNHRSIGEQKVFDYLENKNILFEEQKKFDGCVGYKRKLSFDFYLPKEKIAIEFNGRQHYDPVEYFGGINKLKIQQEYDRRKSKFAAKLGIKLITIPYWQLNEIEAILEEGIK